MAAEQLRRRSIIAPLSGIITDYSDFNADFCRFWLQLQCCDRHVFYGFWVEFEDSEVVYRISVDRSNVALPYVSYAQ